MTISEQLLLAVTVATRAHKGQVRKDGTDYISHPVRVAVRCDTKEQKIVALLHDVVEDTDMTLDELRELGFDRHIIEAVDAMTKRPGEVYLDEFIPRCKADPIARVVKLADIDDNMEDQSALDPEEAKFLSNRYTKAREILNA